MTLLDYAILLAIGVLSAAGQYLLKLALTAMPAAAPTGPVGLIVRAATNPSFLLAGVAYVAAFAIYLVILSKSDVSQIFPIAIGVNILCVVLMAGVFLGETVTLPRIVGILAIVTGVYVVSRF